MSVQDILALVASLGLGFALLLGVQRVAERFRIPLTLTRKVVHVTTGMLVFWVLFAFENWFAGVVAYALFVPLTYYFYRRQTFSALNGKHSSPGTIYFVFSVSVLLAIFWRTGDAIDLVPIAVAAIMSMTWGDATAAIVGTHWGRHPYRIGEQTLSWEGSIGMAAATLVAVALTLWLLPGSVLSPTSAPLSLGRVVFLAIVSSAVATSAEALSPKGTDNLTVPFSVALALALLW